MPALVSKTYYALPKELYKDSRALKNVIQGSAEYTRFQELKVKKPRKK